MVITCDSWLRLHGMLEVSKKRKVRTRLSGCSKDLKLRALRAPPTDWDVSSGKCFMYRSQVTRHHPSSRKALGYPSTMSVPVSTNSPSGRCTTYFQPTNPKCSASSRSNASCCNGWRVGGCGRAEMCNCSGLLKTKTRMTTTMTKRMNNINVNLTNRNVVRI